MKYQSADWYSGPLMRAALRLRRKSLSHFLADAACAYPPPRQVGALARRPAAGKKGVVQLFVLNSLEV